MRDVMRNANTYYTQNMDHPPFLDATDADIDAALCSPKTRARLKRCLVLRDQINHYLPPQAGFFWVGQQTIDLAHKEIIEEMRKVLDAGPIEIR